MSRWSEEQLEAVEYVELDAIRKLAADRFAAGDIDEAFKWETTPQGHDFWDQLYDRLIEAAKTGDYPQLTPEDKEFLEALLEHHTAKEQTNDEPVASPETEDTEPTTIPFPQQGDELTDEEPPLMHIVAPGSRVLLDGGVEGWVISVAIRSNDYVQYEVTWWEEGQPCSAFFESYQISVIEPNSKDIRRIGFC